MHREFQDLLVSFYQNIVKKNSYSNVLTHSLERYLSFVDLEDDRSRDKERDTEQIRSYKSSISNRSTDSMDKIKKLFHSSHIEAGILFAYFLSMLKSHKMDQLNLIFKSVSYRLKQYDKFISPETKKQFSIKITRLSEELQFLNARLDSNCKIQWLYYEMFQEFEGECVLFAQLLSSLGDTLQSEQILNDSDYMNLCAALQIKVYVLDYQKKMPFELGTGDTKLYLGFKSDIYFIESQKQFQRSSAASRKELRQPAKKEESEGKNLLELKKYPTLKFKQQFLSQMTKLKQQYQANTTKIASLFNFKDSVAADQKLVDEAWQA